jgi:hypothetical protein
MSARLSLIGRTSPLFSADIAAHESELGALIASSRFLVIRQRLMKIPGARIVM